MQAVARRKKNNRKTTTTMSLNKSLQDSGVTKWAAIFFAIAFFILLLHTCNKSQEVTYSQAYVDSIKAHDQFTSQESKRKMDSASKEGEKLDELIKAKDREIDVSLAELRKTSANADRWHSLYKAARENHDTVTMVYACDSVIAEFDEYRIATKATISDFQYKDSLRDERIDGLLYENDIARKQINADSILKKQLFAEVDTHIKKDKQQERKIKGRKFWRWTERVAIIAGTIFLTSKAK